jgi:uncharacterized protein (TIGR04141 family)
MRVPELATRLMNVYRMYASENLRELVAEKVATGQQYEIQDVRVGPLSGLLVSGTTEPSIPEWVPALRSLTGVELGFISTIASAALFIRVDGVCYALAFGQGRHYLRAGKVDREFGLDIAVRALDPDDIRKITRWALSAKSRVDHSIVPGGQGLWAYGLREHAELVRTLTGKALDEVEFDLTYVRRRGHYRNFRLSLDCADSVHVPLGIEGDSLIADLRELSRIADTMPVKPQLGPLRWVRRLGQGDARRAAFDVAVAELLAEPDPDRGEVGIAYPARYNDGPTVHEYRGRIGGEELRTDELTIDDLRAGVREHGPERRLAVLRASHIEGFDESGATLGGELSALHWMAAEIVTGARRAILLDGDWYELGSEYLAHVGRVVTDAFANAPQWTLPPWQEAPRDRDGRVLEQAYNEYVAARDRRFLCLDRRLVQSSVHPRGFEACDLLGPDNELVHVKKSSRSTGSSVLSHLFAQGLVAIESLTDTGTWAAFRERVREQDPARAETLGTRPTALVYAIHRTDRVLRPDTLFTFARSALVSACTAAARANIQVRVAVIP